MVKAQLWIHLRPVKAPTTVFVQILRLVKPMKDGTRFTGIRSLKLDMSPGAGIWQSIDVKTVLQNWLKQPESNLGIEIKALDENGRDLAVTFPGPGEDGLVSEEGQPLRSHRDGNRSEWTATGSSAPGQTRSLSPVPNKSACLVSHRRNTLLIVLLRIRVFKKGIPQPFAP